MMMVVVVIMVMLEFVVYVHAHVVKHCGIKSDFFFVFVFVFNETLAICFFYRPTISFVVILLLDLVPPSLAAILFRMDIR